MIVIISLVISFTLGIIVGEYMKNRNTKETNKTYNELLNEIIGKTRYNAYQEQLDRIKYKKQYSYFNFSIRNYININDYIRSN
jgi:hypothetical protein|nr:MAG TPA: Protein of unknown function (DUF1043) [Caudoviricetes sp.]